jgi:hypothetical protein
MIDITVFQSGTSPDFVRVILNTARACARVSSFGPNVNDTTQEVQTIMGYNFRAFETECWRVGLTVTDARSW